MSFHEDRLRTLAPETLRGMHRGIEKESLRVRSDGALSQAPHPPALGSPLTHPHITTDFSEAQLELITGVHGSVEACLQELAWIHQFVYCHIGDEILWCASMPCNLPADNQIPIGRYGTSNVGRAKTVYRLGLALRYGRRMQAISGIHYNWSLPGVTDAQYFALIRNFRRHSWLPIYLFGASPAACSSFVEGRKHELVELSPGTMYAPHATSLRMGPLGYQSDAQSALRVSYNDLKSYAASLDDALTKPYPPYAGAGMEAAERSRRARAGSMGRPGRVRRRADRRGARPGEWRQRASRCPRRRAGGAAHFRQRALGESAAGDGARAPQLLRSLRARRVDAAQGQPEGPRAAARSDRAVHGPRRLVARAPARDRGRGQSALRGLAAEISVA